MVLFKVAAPLAAVLAAAPAEGVAVHTHPRLRGSETATISMHLYRHDCGRASGFSFAQIPGAGMTPEAIQPFQTVLKDGFQPIDCVKDYMFEHGDKFGDNKASYKLGDLTNVSIVHYAAHVPKEDREPMTHEVCFRFCRTVPDMTIFGLTNGRECYCAPYYQAEASDSSDCDAVCDGDKGTMCGGKTKSSVFSMHLCADTKEDLSDALARMLEAAATLAKYTSVGEVMSTTVQESAASYQEKFGHAGDPGAADLMQAAKVRAGVADEMMRRASARLAKATELKGRAEALAQGGHFGSSETAVEAEELIKAVERATADIADSSAELEQEFSATFAVLMAAEGANGTAKQYYAAAYFVDPTLEQYPSTCTGAASEQPIAATLDGCARACDNDVHECVAFQHVAAAAPPQGAPEGIGSCFLFSKLATLRYYTNCGQVGAAVECRAKLSKFEGTSIKPDASGKCEGCLKEVKQADRCWQ